MRLRGLVAALTAAVCIACPATPAGTGDAGADDDRGTTTADAGENEDAAEIQRTLMVSPPALEAFIDELATFRAFLEAPDGLREDVTGEVDWLLDGDLIGTFKAPGVVLVAAQGTAQVIARLGEQEASATLTGLAADANVVNLTIEPPTLEIPVGLSAPLRAVAIYDDGQAREVTALASWESLAPATFAVETGGPRVLLRGLAEGAGQIRASFAGQQVEAAVTVVAASLVAIELFPADPYVPAGGNLQVHAIGRFADGELYPLTDVVTWSSSSNAIFTVAGPPAPPGTITGVSEGTASLTARSEADAIEVSATVTVTPAQIVDLNISPALIRVPAGGSIGLRATAVLTTEVVIDVTGQCQWEVVDPEAAFFTAGPGRPFRLEAVFPTETTVRATYAGFTAEAPLIITEAELELVELYPATWTIAEGQAQQLWLLGTYSDGARVDLSTDASWSSNRPDIAFVTDAPPGRVVAVTAGHTTISASYGGMTGTSEIQVTDAAVVSIQIHPPLATIPAGEDMRFVVIGIYTDESQRDLTAEVTWSVDDEAIATISNAVGEWGRAVGQAPGSVTVSAQYGDLGDTATLHISDAVVDTLLVTPGWVTLTPGRGEQLQAWASYSDGTTLQVGARTVWTTADGSVVEVSNAAGEQGWLTAMAPGDTQVTGRFGGVTGTSYVYVLDEPFEELFIWPPQLDIAPGVSEQLYLVGTYASVPGDYEYLTAEAIWESNDPGIASVGNWPSEPGLLRARTPGVFTITARLGDQSASQTFQVRDLQVTGLELSPPDPLLPIDSIQAFVALASFEDGSTRDVSADTSFTSDDNTVATMFEYWPGNAWALAPGQATITGRFLEQTATTLVTVIDEVPQQVFISPVNPIVEQYGATQFYATAIYTNGSSGDITYLCTWSCSNPQVLLVLDEPFGKGYGYAISVGSATVTAQCGDLGDFTIATVR